MKNKDIATICLVIQLVSFVLSFTGIGTPVTTAIAILGVIPVLYFNNKN